MYISCFRTKVSNHVPLVSRPGPSGATGRGFFSLLPPSFPAVPQYFNHTPVVPGPSQNRTWCVTPSGSQFGSSTETSLCVKRASFVVMVFLRSVSGHVSLARYPKPAPLCSVRITGPHRSYGWLRLPTATALFLAPHTCPRVRNSSYADCRISLVTA